MARRVPLWLAAVVLVVACGSGEADRVVSTSAPATPAPLPTTPTTPTAAPVPRSTVATATVPLVNVHDSPDQPQPSHALEHPVKPQGTPLVLLVVEEQPEWLKVLVPVRPNGTTGWVRRSDVSVQSHTFRILVELGAHRLTVWKGNDVLAEEPIGVGREEVPTPEGFFYTFQLLKTVEEQDQRAYGPYAYSLSGFSEVLTNFMGGEGRLAIHGTSDPSSVGKDVSHGCIRMTNEAITRLVGALPIGVPVEVRA